MFNLAMTIFYFYLERIIFFRSLARKKYTCDKSHSANIDSFLDNITYMN